MRTSYLALSAATIIAARAAVWGTVTADDLARVVSGIYDGKGGAADVDADGAATAADVLGALNGLRSPAWPGPYRVGLTVPPPEMESSDEVVFTKNSETTGQPRPLPTWVWYPTDAEGTVDATFLGIRNAAVSTSGPFPLIMFSHGSCGFPEQSPFYTAHLASHGFIVAAPPHPGNQLGDPNCGGFQAQADSFGNRPADVSFVIDSLLALNDEPTSRFFQTIDAEHIGMSGHSFGGLTTLRVVALDDRIDTAVALAPAYHAANIVLVPPSEFEQIIAARIPFMIQGAANDTTTPFPTNQQEPFDMLPSPRYLLKIFDAGHLVFAQICGTRLCPEQQMILRYATPLFLAHLSDDDQFAAFLDPAAAPAGVEYTADP
jgi:predicted dienelactone hydrolase